MAKDIAFENGRISNFQGFVTLTLDQVILHAVMHHSSTSTYMPNFVEIEEMFVDKRRYVRVRLRGQTNGQTDGQTGGHLKPTLLGRLFSSEST